MTSAGWAAHFHTASKNRYSQKDLGFLWINVEQVKKKKDIFKKLSIWLHCSFHLLRNRTCPMLWMQPRSQISWAFIPCVIVTGTSRPPAPPVGMACTKGSTGSPTSSKTLNDPFHPLPLLSALCVWMCLKADSTGFSLVYPFLSLVQSCIRQRLCPVLSLIHMQECACVYVCVYVCVNWGWE